MTAPNNQPAPEDEIRPMTAEERKALDKFTMKELTESEPASDLTQPGLPKAGLTQPGAEVASEQAEAKAIRERAAFLTAHRACHSAEHDPANGKLHGYCVVCGVPFPCDFAKPQEESTIATLRAQLEAKEEKGLTFWKELARMTQEGMNELKSRFEAKEAENDKLRAEVERLTKAAVPLCVGKPLIQILAKEGQWASEDGQGIVAADCLFQKDPYETITRLTAEVDAVRKERDAEVHQTEAFIRALGFGWSGAKTIEDRQEFLKAIHQSYLRWIEWKEEAQARCGELERLIGELVTRKVDAGGVLWSSSNIAGLNPALSARLESLLTPPIAPEGKATEGEG